MKRFVWSCGVLVTIALFLPDRAATAQGVASAAVAGRITDESGAPVPAAQLTLVNGSTGQRYAARSRDDGRYSFENVDVGGPYTLAARALGFEPKTSTPFNLQLGQRFALDLNLKRAAVELAGVIVETSSNPLLSNARTGAQTFISDSALRRLPTLNRAFNDFVNTSPQIVKTPGGGTSFTGQNDRFNNIQIDGTVNNDLFALGASNQVPGGGVNARPLSIEAVKEYQVLVAPFDVRQGGFVGGLINAVTKSGTNQFHGSAFAYMQNENFVGADTGTCGEKCSIPVADYKQQQYGFSFGGPIVRDRLHFFVTGDFRHDNRPFATSIQLGPTGDTTGVGITQARFDSVQQILTTQYGFDPGTWRAPQINNPETNLFGKLDLELGTNSQVEVSGTLINVNQDKLIHTYRNGFTQPPSLSNARDGYELSGSGYYMKDETRTLRGKWTASFGNRFSNELIVGRTTIADNRPPVSNHPLILVGGNSAGTYIAAGAERFSHANSLDQRVVEVSDNVTFPAGNHLLTVGTHNEFIHFRNVFFPLSMGVWNFANPAALAAGTPNLYARALPGVSRPDGPVADFDVTQVGFYGQDRFTPVPNLTVTAGVRIDVPSVPAPAFNTALDTGVVFPTLGTGVDTRSSPSGNILWSPRLGFNYDVGGRQATILRGGIGVFSGRPPYVWVSNAYGNTGLEQRTVSCNGAASGPSTDTVPAFTVDPNNQPRKCGAQGPTSDSALASATSIVFYDPNFKFPQALKLALGVDRALPWNLFATVDFILTKAINQYYLQDVNLRGIQGASSGEAGRPLYGTINPATGGATVSRVTNRANDVIQNRNVSKDQSTSLAFQLQKRFSDGLEFSAAYTYSHSLDVMSMTSDITSSNYNFGALDGTIANRNLRTSAFDRPHKVSISGTVNAPFGARFSLIYNGVSGTPFTYVVSGDANADGVFGNDLAYVARNRADMSMDGNGASAAGFGTVAQQDSVYGILDAYINNEPCLRDNRGRLLPRNSCHNSWQNFLNARLSWAIPTVSGHTLEITADMLNVLNFINSGWGLIRQTGTGFEEQNLISQTGYDAANGRGIYALAIPPKNAVTINSIGSRWVFQLGTRYTF
ncbi:MAG: TonB-dependent receptor [Bacillati bacterium ANGP1]|uniref:TonB-dependent receptor n=1 Tax=Candidatus Segetimicrobium genomatis TaxID=2569760 RepID=A0A537IK19_9BACT|nr:MAG: TonB-dependent receptor [Terrabacteria group bacterium ANGP1]